VTGDLYATIRAQAQSGAASYGTGLFWPVTVILACLCGSGALALVRTRKRTLLALNGSSLALISGPYVALAQMDLLNELLTLLGSRVPQRRGPIQWHVAGSLSWRWGIWPHERKISSPQDN